MELWCKNINTKMWDKRINKRIINLIVFYKTTGLIFAEQIVNERNEIDWKALNCVWKILTNNYILLFKLVMHVNCVYLL